mgnify:FL=1
MPEGEKKDKTADYPVDKDGNKLKPCCVCPETKRPRDECIMEKVNTLMNLTNKHFLVSCSERYFKIDCKLIILVFSTF